ncbi:MAG: hypothetical protein HOP25_02735 [Methylotenera sp.]|nr:hypothetical protein [Methylotenera sp.]
MSSFFPKINQQEAPAFQEYAANLLARRDFKALKLESKGLLWAMRLEYWVNGDFNDDAAQIGAILGVSTEDIARLLPTISTFLATDGKSIGFEDLSNYKLSLEAKRAKQSAGGKQTQEKKLIIKQGVTQS